jgi:WD40 repeat protein
MSTPSVAPFSGHPGWVSSVAYSPDGQCLAVAGAGGAVSVWDARSGALRQRLVGHPTAITDVVFSPDGSRLATAGEDRTVRVWDAASGSEVLCVPIPERTTAVAYHPDGSALAIADDAGGIMLADASGGRIWRRIVHPGRPWWTTDASVHDVAFSPDGTRLATAGNDGSARVWDVDTGENTLTIFCHENWPSQEDLDEIFAVKFSPDGLRLVTSTYCATTRVWDARTGEEQLSMPSGFGRSAVDVAFSPDGTLLAAAIPAGARVWDASTGRQVWDLLERVSALAFSPDGLSLAVGMRGKAEVLRIPDGESLLSVPQRGLAPWHLAFSPDGTRLASAGYGDAVALLWDVRGGFQIGQYKGPDNEVLDIEPDFEPQDLKHLVFSPGGEFVAGLSHRMVRLWDAASGVQRHVLNLGPPHRVPVNAGAFGPDGTRLATGHDDGSIRVWDTGRGICERVLPGRGKATDAVAFSADGTELVAVGVDRDHDEGQPWGTVHVWDLRTGEGRLVHTIEGVAGQEVRLAADGSLFAKRAADGSVQIWDTRGDILRSTLDGSGDAFPDYWENRRLRWKLHGLSADATRLAAGDDGDVMTDREGGWVRLWDTTTAEVLLTVRCHAGAVKELVFSPDNALFATTSDLDSTTRLWDGRTGAQVGGTDFTATQMAWGVQAADSAGP